MSLNRVASMSRFLVVPAVSVFLALAVSACCKSGGDDNKCPSSYSSLSAEQKAAETTCKCDSSNTSSGSVWGSSIYTTDSSICRAAVHAGATTTAGGDVTVKGAPGCSAYVGTNQNGINSGAWGSYQGSFYFPSKGDGKCSAAPATPPTAAAGDLCPRNFKSVPGLNANTTITCKCDAGLSAGGPVWGSDIYTQDSSICRAALHAGAITSSGGSVTAKAASGCKKYDAKTRNGVASSKWGSYDASFYFPSKNNGACL